MKKLFTVVLIGLLFLSVGICFADTENINKNYYYKPTMMDKIENSTMDFAETVGDATSDAAHTTGIYIKEKSKAAASATHKAVKEGAKKTGEAVKSGAEKAGNATKRGAKKTGHAVKSGAKKATNWSARKIRDGADKVIIKTQDVNESSVQTSEQVKE